jgi:hypothetical protein
MGQMLETLPERFPIQPYQSAQVTPLGGPCPAVGGQVLSLIGIDMELVLDQPLAAGTAVRVETHNWIMLGAVLYCARERTRHKIRVRLEHALPGLRDLADRNRSFFGRAARTPLASTDGNSGYT